nr:MAG TPA: hypothetical protein [Caudoviricetes sp.]DAX50465.1 MAG TPA: hypothetical protein [Caudoviricetes sp.]
MVISSRTFHILKSNYRVYLLRYKRHRLIASYTSDAAPMLLP